jgi:hypothetical protein
MTYLVNEGDCFPTVSDCSLLNLKLYSLFWKEIINKCKNKKAKEISNFISLKRPYIECVDFDSNETIKYFYKKYGFYTDDVKKIIKGFKIALSEALEDLDDTKIVSVRKEPSVDKNENKTYTCSFRIAIVPNKHILSLIANKRMSDAI